MVEFKVSEVDAEKIFCFKNKSFAKFTDLFAMK